MLKRGFWLYVWKITPADGSPRCYVGRTGDSSSPHAQSPFSRLSQHLGSNKRANALRRHLEAAGLEPTTCRFELVSYGPVYPEAADFEAHKPLRNEVAAHEKALAEAMRAAGYDVLNTVDCRHRLDEARFAPIRAAFAEHFPELETTGQRRLAR